MSTVQAVGDYRALVLVRRKGMKVWDQKIRLYEVKCWQSAQGERKYGRHLNFGVVAAGAPDAMNHVATEHPDVRIDAVNDRGIVHYVLETPDFAATVGEKP
jgi:hypothetical protein